MGFLSPPNGYFAANDFLLVTFNGTLQNHKSISPKMGYVKQFGHLDPRISIDNGVFFPKPHDTVEIFYL